MPVLSEIRAPDRAAPRYWPARPFPPTATCPDCSLIPFAIRTVIRTRPIRVVRRHRRGPPRVGARCADWLFGVDLFNAFFFWEAHESWEGLWAAQPRRSAARASPAGTDSDRCRTAQDSPGSTAGATTLSRQGLEKVADTAASQHHLLGLDLGAALAQFTHYFRPLLQRTLPPLDASVPLLLLAGLSDE